MKNWQLLKGIKPYYPGNWEVTNGKVSYWFETEEWARFFMDHCERLDEAVKPRPVYPFVLDAGHSITIYRPEMSEWTCHLFGSNDDGISWVPRKGHAPNWFWRKMQYLFFGNKWVKK